MEAERPGYVYETGSCLSHIITAAVLHAYRISYGGVRDDTLMPTRRNADHRIRQYVAALPTQAIRLTITLKRDMIVNPVGRHSGRPFGIPIPVKHSKIAATNF